MGIKDFNKNIKQEYPEAFKSVWLSFYDYIYIDLNFALHHCSHEIKKLDDIYCRLFKFVENILLETNPRKKVYFTSDGSAPLAKLLLQRDRRSVKAKSIENIEEASSLLFTPGTEFMNTLKIEMNAFMTYLSHIFNVDVEFLEKDSDEAELKLKKKIMENISEDKSGILTHLFVSNDADVVLMLTTLENYKNVFIFDKKANHILSIYKLMDLHTTKVGITQNSGLDFTALNLMLGNDYLPKVHYVDYFKLWEAYAKISFNNPSGLILKNNNCATTINESFFIKLMNELIANLKPSFLNKPTQKELMSSMYKNYYDGFAWCMTTYIDGVCTRYNYMFGYDTKPHPLGLMFNMNYINNNFLEAPSLLSDPLPSSLYSILLLPKSHKHLIDKKYHNFVEKEKGLYTQECCEKCKYFNVRIRELESKAEDLENAKQATSKIRSEVSKIKKTLTLHKKQHSVLALDDIDELKTRFDKIK